MDRREAIRVAKDYADFHGHGENSWLANFEAQARACGYQIVPIEPTEAMDDAGEALIPDDGCRAYEIYCAMLKASKGE